jgi:hypothetical protein
MGHWLMTRAGSYQALTSGPITKRILVVLYFLIFPETIRSKLCFIFHLSFYVPVESEINIRNPQHLAE